MPQAKCPISTNGVSEIMAPNNFGSALSKAALKDPLKGPLTSPLKAVIGRLQLISCTSCGVIKSKPRRRRRRRGAAAAPSNAERWTLRFRPWIRSGFSFVFAQVSNSFSLRFQPCVRSGFILVFAQVSTLLKQFSLRFQPCFHRRGAAAAVRRQPYPVSATGGPFVDTELTTSR